MGDCVLRAAVIALVLCGGVSSAWAQDCTPTMGWFHSPWSNDPANALTNPAGTTAHVYGQHVPPGKIWKMRTIAIATNDGRQMEYFLEHLIRLAPYAPGQTEPVNGWHFHRIEGGIGWGTPPLSVAPADAAAVILLPGEMVAARASSHGGPMLNNGMILIYSYFEFPEACLARALGMEP